MQTGRNKILRGTKETPASMIMAGSKFCGGGRVGRTRQEGCSFFMADAIWADAGRAGDGAAGADSADAGAAVGNAGRPEWAIDDGEVLRRVSGGCYGLEQAAAESAGWLDCGRGGIWRICDCAFH